MRTPYSLKRKQVNETIVTLSDLAMESNVADESTWIASVTCHPQCSSSGASKRPMRVKQAKLYLDIGKICGQATRAPTQASVEMATHRKA